jgi:hypothetical protein
VKKKCIRAKVLANQSNYDEAIAHYLDTVRFISIEQFKFSCDVEELEIGSCESWHCFLNHKKFVLQCEILSSEIEIVNPGLVKNTTVSIKQNKRLPSQHDLANLSKKTYQLIAKPRSQISISQNSTTQVNEYDSELEPEFELKKLKDLAAKDEFPKKLFLIENKIKSFTSTLHFFTSKRKFEKLPSDNVDFICKICNAKLKAPLAKHTNLYKHLKKHPQFREWRKIYNTFTKKTTKPVINDNMFDFIKFFITSNCSFSVLENEYLIKLLGQVMHLPGVQSFRKTLLTEAYDILRNAIESKLNNAETICLISDIWTNENNSDFIALIAVLTDSDFEREFLIIDMMRMPGNSHTAENIKIAIETMVILCH